MTIDNAPPKAGRREWIALAVLALPTLLVTADLNMLFLALPRIAADLQAGPLQQLWITDIYGFVIAGFTITMGNVGDRIGHRKLLVIGAAVFAGASILCAYSTTAEMLIVSRALLGLAGATLTPLTLAMIVGMFPNPKEMGAALGIWSSALMAGIVLGPPIGGLLLNAFWWGSVFLIAVPIMVLLLIVSPLLPASKNPAAGPIDIASVLLFLVSILPIVQGLKDIARTGFGTRPAIFLAVGIVAIVLFLRRQARIPNPLLDLTLFKNRVIRSGIGLFISNAILAGAMGLMVALYLQLVDGLSPLAAGLWMLPGSLALIVFTNIVPKIANNVRPAYVIAGGMLVSVIGQILFTQVGATGGLALLVVGLAITLVGGAPIGPVANTVVMSSAPPEKAGGLGGLIGTCGELGAALGIAVLGSVATIVYRADVTIPAGTPADVADPAGQSLAGAAAAAPNLPPGQRDGVLSAAHDAFASGLNVVAIITAVAFVGLAFVAWRGMRHVPPLAAAHAGPPAEGPEGEAEAPEATAA